ncbi:MAG: hypothetical protein K0Q49_372 [Haloplasmataceae bacterium]|jgi:ABC-2 type transport system permease protein|nr:hypothetical protein [Haloplasmataceae bacterium]
MKDFLLTLKFLFKQNMSLKYMINHLKNDKRQRNMFIVIAVILALSTPSLGAFIFLYIKMYDIFAMIGQESFYIVIAIIFSVIIIILFGMFQVTSYFYLSDDVKILTPLPIKTKHILISKFVVIYIWELMINLFSVLPFFIIYGVKSGLDILAWINLIMSFLLLPIIPLVIVGILVVIIMKFTNIFKNKDAFRMIGMLSIIILVIGVQMYIQSIAMNIPTGKEEEYFQNLFSNNQFLLEKVELYYPIITLVINSIIGDSLLRIVSIVLFFILSVGSVYIFGFILESVYLKTYLNEQVQISKNRKVKHESNKSQTVSNSIMSIDMKTLFRVPMFALNCLSTVIIVPVILLITVISTGEISQLKTFYEPNKYIFWLICTLALTIFGSLNMITTTSFSREGKTNWIMRTLPISSKEHIKGRVLSSIIVQITFCIISIGILLYLLKVDYFFGILTLVLAILASLPINLVGLYIDLKHPLLKWDNPQVAVKQNMNVLITLAISMIYATIMFLIYFGLSKILNNHSLLNFFILYVIYMLVNIILTSLLYSKIDRQFEENLILME